MARGCHCAAGPARQSGVNHGSNGAVARRGHVHRQPSAVGGLRSSADRQQCQAGCQQQFSLDDLLWLAPRRAEALGAYRHVIVRRRRQVVRRHIRHRWYDWMNPLCATWASKRERQGQSADQHVHLRSRDSGQLQAPPVLQPARSCRGQIRTAAARTIRTHTQ
jgi:hypothetical protein